MKKGKEKQTYKLTCDYCGKKFQSSKPFSRFCSQPHRNYFYSKKSILLTYIHSVEAEENQKFLAYLDDYLRKGNPEKTALQKVIWEQKRKMDRYEEIKFKAEKLIMDTIPIGTILTKEYLSGLLKDLLSRKKLFF